MRPMQLFASKYLRAVDLAGVNHDVSISKVVEGVVGEDEEVKPIVFFHQFEKGFCLNVTNCKRIVALYGDDADQWVGKWVTIFPSECDFRGDTVECIRVKKDAPPAKQRTQPQQTSQPQPAMTPEMAAQFAAFMAAQTQKPT